MFSNFFADPKTLLLGAITGLLFGFLLQKGSVTRYNVIVNQFRLKDHTVLKTMLTAIIVGAIGVYAMLQMGMIQGLHVKGAAIAMNAIGGGIFGVGMVLLGYCPGTALAAAGQGSRDAIVGIIGAIVGAAAYAEVYPWISRTIEPLANFGKVTLADVTHIPVWIIIAVLAGGASGLFVWLERRESAAIQSV